MPDVLPGVADRLAAHIEVAARMKGETVTNADAFYRDGLSRLDAEGRQVLAKLCEARGLTADIGTGPIGQMYLALRKVA